MKYFIGNWKMFGVSKSANIIKKIIDYVKKDKKKSNYKVVIAPLTPYFRIFLKILIVNF